MQVFAPVRAMDVRSLAGPALDVQVPSGSVLVHEGKLLGTFFVIRSGTAELWQEGCRVGVLQTGDCFGEIDPMELRPQGYSVIATSPMRVLTFSAYGIGRLCSAIPSVRNRLLAYLPCAAKHLHAVA
jgi:CRP-like cAMP-binding protein